MKRGRIIAFVGLVLFLTGLVVTGLTGYFTIISGTLCGLGLVALCALAVPRLGRNLPLYVNVTFYCIFYVACLVVMFLVVQQHPAAYDATKDQQFSLTSITKNFLRKNLARPVHVTAFVTDRDRADAVQLLREYVRYSPEFSYEIANPFRDVAKARRFGATVTAGDVFAEAVTTDTQVAERIVKLGKLTEEELTNAIVQLLRGKQLTLYFLTGHGELSLEETDPAVALTGKRQRLEQIALLKHQLEFTHVRTLPLILAQRGRVPADASMIVSVAPRTDISASERDTLKSYLDGGGKAMFLLDPDLPSIGGEMRVPLRNVADLLEQFGIILPAEVVVEPTLQEAGGDIFTLPVQLRPHPITQMPDGYPLFFTHARPVLMSRAAPPNVTFEPLLFSPADSWRMPMEDYARALLAGGKGRVKFNLKEVSQCGLGVAVTMLPPGASEEQSARIVVIGNGSFTSTELLGQAGWLLFSNAVNWLSNAGDLIAIPSHEIENTPVTLSSGQRQFLFMLLVVIVPSLIGFIGVWYSAARREIQ